MYKRKVHKKGSPSLRTRLIEKGYKQLQSANVAGYPFFTEKEAKEHAADLRRIGHAARACQIGNPYGFGSKHWIVMYKPIKYGNK